MTHDMAANPAPQPGSGGGLDLAAENQRLRERLAGLLEQAAHHHAIMTRHQTFDLDIVSAANFPELIRTVFRTLPRISELDSVTLTLLDDGGGIRIVMEKLGVDFADFPELRFADKEAGLGFGRPARPGGAPRPLLGPFDAAVHGAALPSGARALRSVALVPLLRNKRLIGSLNLGSADPRRFTPAQGTDFIEHMASIIAICLENVISNEMLKYIGLTDALTGVYNRRYIDRRLPEEIARARRQAYHISCLYIDIDHFKRVNDANGHQAGDEVLREVAARIKAELRRSDTLGRFGGEEFVALLINSDLANSAMVAERIRAGVVGQPIALADGAHVTVSVSIGAACLHEPEPAPGAPIDSVAHQLIGHADAALYRAKAGGRNRVVSVL